MAEQSLERAENPAQDSGGRDALIYEYMNPADKQSGGTKNVPYLQGHIEEKNSIPVPKLKADTALYDQPEQDPKEAEAEIDNLVGKIKKDADPDAGDKELLIAWNKWHNQLHQSILKLFTAQLNSQKNMIIDHEEFRNGVLTQVGRPKYTLGSEVLWFKLKVDNNLNILDRKILHSSGVPECDQMLLDTIDMLQGKKILRFPKGSQRAEVSQMNGVYHSDKNEKQSFDYGDIEKVRQPD